MAKSNDSGGLLPIKRPKCETNVVPAVRVCDIDRGVKYVEQIDDTSQDLRRSRGVQDFCLDVSERGAGQLVVVLSI